MLFFLCFLLCNERVNFCYGFFFFKYIIIDVVFKQCIYVQFVVFGVVLQEFEDVFNLIYELGEEIVIMCVDFVYEFVEIVFVMCVKIDKCLYCLIWISGCILVLVFVYNLVIYQIID